MPQYRVIKQFGLVAVGETVEEDEKAAAPYVGTHLEPVDAASVARSAASASAVETDKPAPNARKR